MSTAREYQLRLSSIMRGEAELDDETAVEFLRALTRWAAARLLMAELAIATQGEKGVPMHGVEARQVGQLVEQVENMRRVIAGRPPLTDRESWKLALVRSVNVEFRKTVEETPRVALPVGQGGDLEVEELSGAIDVEPTDPFAEYAPKDDVMEMVSDIAKRAGK